MTDYEKLKDIIDEIDILIEKHVSSSNADFQAWMTKAERFLIRKFGNDSLEHTKFKETHFSLTIFYWGTPDSKFVEACRSGLETTKAVFLTYLKEMEEIEEKKVDTINIYQKIKTKQCFWFFRSFVSRYIGFTI